MAMEKLVIFTNQGPGPETITNLENGLLCNPFSAEDIADKICWVFLNEEKVKKMENKARTLVIEKFSSDVIVKKNLDFYYSILKN
jgi:glycosyltransferase involved in cell wall biosynthesis